MNTEALKRARYKYYHSEKGKIFREKYKIVQNKKRRDRLLASYGLTKETFEKMFVEQRGMCALCKEPFLGNKPVIDHCHKTGKVRGLLHSSCNVLLGMAHDSKNILSLAISYINGENKMDNSNIEPTGFTTAQRDAIPANQLKAGLLILNTTTAKLNFWDGTGWVAVTSA